MNVLPESWIECTLGEVCEKPQYGWTSKASQTGKIKYLRTTDLSSGKVNWDAVPYCLDEPDDVEKYQVKDNDIVISRAGSVGLSYRVENPPPRAVFASYLIRIRALTVEHKYLEYFLQSAEYWRQISDVAAGIAVQNINATKLTELQIPLAPLHEQKRIVAKLDTLFAHLDQLRARLQNIPTLLKQFRQSVLTQAVTGKLTEDWRGSDINLNFDYYDQFDSKAALRDTNYTIPGEWQFLSFSEVALVKSHLVQPLEYLDFPLIAPDNIESETGRLISKPLVKDIMPKSAKHYFESGNIIYSKIRPYLSKLIIADFSGLCSADMYPIQPKIDTHYLFFYMLSKEFLEYATTAGTRTVLPKINQKELSIIPVPVPSPEEQRQITQRIETLFEIADRIEVSYNLLQEKIDHLPQAILSKAFCGELVDQDPEDEPAAVLLERIKQSRLYDKPREVPSIIEKYFEEVTFDIMEIYEVIEDAKRKLTAKEVWQKSRFKDDIDGFYAELKEEVEVKKRIKESEDGKYLVLDR